MATAMANAPTLQVATQTLTRNLGRMIDAAHRQGVELALLTYPSSRFSYGRANKILRSVARVSGAPLIEIRGVFEKACSDEECSEYLFPDHHANARGYRLVAAEIEEWLRTEIPRPR